MKLDKKMLKDKKYVLIDYNSENSIKNAESEKFKMENKGYNLEKTIPKGLNKFMLVYRK